MTEIKEATVFYRAEEYHQQVFYLPINEVPTFFRPDKGTTAGCIVCFFVEGDRPPLLTSSPHPV